MAAEAGLAFVLGAGWFVLLSLLVGTSAFSSRAVLAVTVILLDVAVVWMLARLTGIGYAVAVGVAGVVALDWYCIPPIHSADVPNAENGLALGAYLSPAPCSVSSRRPRGDAPRSPSARSGSWPRNRRPSGGWRRWSRSSPLPRTCSPR